MYEETNKILLLPTDNNQPVMFENHTRLTLREKISTLFLCTALDHVNFPIVPFFQLDVVPEVVEFDKKVFRTGGDA
jgi:hypothetical protein